MNIKVEKVICRKCGREAESKEGKIICKSCGYQLTDKDITKILKEVYQRRVTGKEREL